MLMLNTTHCVQCIGRRVRRDQGRCCSASGRPILSTFACFIEEERHCICFGQKRRHIAVDGPVSTSLREGHALVVRKSSRVEWAIIIRPFPVSLLFPPCRLAKGPKSQEVVRSSSIIVLAPIRLTRRPASAPRSGSNHIAGTPYCLLFWDQITGRLLYYSALCNYIV